MTALAGRTIVVTRPERQAAGLALLIEEAGGRFFNFDGRSSIYGGNCVACAPGLEGATKHFLGLI